MRKQFSAISFQHCSRLFLASCYAIISLNYMQSASRADELASPGWTRSADNPVLSLAPAPAFDSHNIMGPAIAKHKGKYYLYFCGGPSGPATKEKFIDYQLGLATSDDGVHFKKLDKPILPLGERDDFHCTPAVLRDPEGNLLLDADGTWHMVYCGNRADDIEHATSTDGIHWKKDPRSPIYHGAYAPNLLRVGDEYRMYYVHKPQDGQPWELHLATGPDLHSLKAHSSNPQLIVSQPWEKKKALFYPYVLKDGNQWAMFYASYWSVTTRGEPEKTAIGTATSADGFTWTKNPANPVFTPVENSKYDSLYTSSQAIMRDGPLYRMFYSGRVDKIHKYFSIALATKPVGKRSSQPPTRTGPDDISANAANHTPTAATPDIVELAKDPAKFTAWRNKTRAELSQILGIPKDRVPLAAEKRGESEHDGVVIERWVFTTEKGSRTPAVLYRPKNPTGPMPAIVFTYGHGGSKSHWSYNYTGQVYAKLGLAVLAIDPIGEEERHPEGRRGTREHDQKTVSDRATVAGRTIMGKLVFDTMRGVDFLMERPDIDHNRIGVAGYSLGGAVAAWMAALEPQIKFALVCGWAYDDTVLRSKYCTAIPFAQMRSRLSWNEFAALAAPECAIYIMNGDADIVIDRDGDGRAWRGTQNVATRGKQVYEELRSPQNILTWFEPEAGHRAFYAYPQALHAVRRYLTTPGMGEAEIRALPNVNAGQWCDAHGIVLEKLYGTDLHDRGANLVDMKLHPTPPADLKCLKPDELGSPDFTIEGWLKTVEGK
ncbi:MAG: acetylxylan esterase [Planctomycetota bacterium]|nr:acetylxylan esterase [Planctomycetota bacterium]